MKGHRVDSEHASRPVAGARMQRRKRLAHCARVNRVLAALVAQGMVQARRRVDGATRYYLTEMGQRLLDE
jgi:hypothetical protein